MTQTMSLKQYDIAEVLHNYYDCIVLLDAIKFIKSIFGSTCTVKDIKIAYEYVYA